MAVPKPQADPPSEYRVHDLPGNMKHHPSPMVFMPASSSLLKTRGCTRAGIYMYYHMCILGIYVYIYIYIYIIYIYICILHVCVYIYIHRERVH